MYGKKLMKEFEREQVGIYTRIWKKKGGRYDVVVF